MIIAVDFDGTCVAQEYPEVGKDIGAVPVLKWLTEQGHQIILWTVRGGSGKPNPEEPDKFNSDDLKDAIDWFENNNIPLFGVNSNPTQGEWTASPKAYAHIYIDDAALGCPLVTPVSAYPNDRVSGRPYVDWVRVKEMLQDIFDGSGAVGYTALAGAGDAQ